ncbi:MAG TPA: SWIM zinc finger family protein [Chloroflexota bacterium]|jgi:uncharacterized Zn finger protein|nr:SWIM zinc finger family protein [Chloroflexota bacterium]
MAKTEQQIITGAFARARGRLAAVRWLGRSAGGYATYAVGSSRDVETGYRVTVGPVGEVLCTCPSELRPACWHRAAVLSVRASRLLFGLSADGPSATEVR